MIPYTMYAYRSRLSLRRCCTNVSKLAKHGLEPSLLLKRLLEFLCHARKVLCFVGQVLRLVLEDAQLLTAFG